MHIYLRESNAAVSNTGPSRIRTDIVQILITIQFAVERGHNTRQEGNENKMVKAHVQEDTPQSENAELDDNTNSG